MRWPYVLAIAGGSAAGPAVIVAPWTVLTLAGVVFVVAIAAWRGRRCT